MHVQKPIGLGLFVGVLALALAALPAMASAVTLENAAGTPLAVGAAVRLESSNLVFAEADGMNIECRENTVTGKVTANAPEPKVNVTAATFKAAGGGANCLTIKQGFTYQQVPAANPPNWTLKFEKEAKFSLTSASGVVGLVKTFNGGPKCETARAFVSGAYNNNLSPATLTLGASQVFSKVAGSEGCLFGNTETATGSFALAGIKIVP
jgi:hypothetical protein